MRLIDPKKIPKMGEPTTLEDTPMYEFAQCLVDYLVENYGVDVPDIVRCKDCAYWQAEWETSAHDPNWHYCSQNDTAFSADEYCSRGDRKDEVTE